MKKHRKSLTPAHSRVVGNFVSEREIEIFSLAHQWRHGALESVGHQHSVVQVPKKTRDIFFQNKLFALYWQEINETNAEIRKMERRSKSKFIVSRYRRKLAGEDSAVVHVHDRWNNRAGFDYFSPSSPDSFHYLLSCFLINFFCVFGRRSTGSRDVFVMND